MKPEAHVIHNVVVIATKSKKEYIKILNNIMKKLHNLGLILNPVKSIFIKDSIQFSGQLLSHHGIKLDLSKAEVLRHAGPPQSKDEVMSFLCMIQSQSDFKPNLSHRTANLRDLNKQQATFHWKTAHHTKRI